MTESDMTNMSGDAGGHARSRLTFDVETVIDIKNGALRVWTR
jgi:hypothetical protein